MPRSTRGLVLALRRLPTTSLVSRGVPVGFTETAGCAIPHQVNVCSQRRGFFWKKKDDKSGEANDDVGDSKPAADTEQKSASSFEAAAVKARSSEEVKAPSSEEVATAESTAEAKDGVIVPVSAAELQRDTGPPFEPHMIALPVLRRPLFPGQQQLVQVTHQGAIKELMKAIDKKDQPLLIGTFLRKDSVPEDQGEKPAEDLSGTDPLQVLYLTGTRARITRIAPFNIAPGNNDKSSSESDPPAQGLQVLLSGIDLIRLEKVLQLGPPLQVQASRFEQQSGPEEGPVADEVKAYINETIYTVREIMKINPQFREHATFIHQGMERLGRNDPHSIAHFAACLTTAAGADLMQVLQTEHPSEKLNAALTLVKKELELSQLQQKITTQIEEKVSSHQREFMLREQLKMLKKELGEDKGDGADTLLQKFKSRLEGKTVPEDAKEAIDSEVEKFGGLAKESQEYQITRNYLDWLTVLPWGVHTEDTLSLRKARTILDRDHYGLSDVKERILELIAVGTLRGSVQGKIICFVGPPGVGKTSIGRSIAQALGREFYRFSVGGLYDVAEIKGHRRTYVGAMPGKIVQCLKKVQSANPLVLIDEVDKIGRGHQGDPASALLELLDPSQNGAFLDHYLDVPVDASKILFVCTANVTDTIPGPLLDRMEVIRLSGYDLQEKIKIAENYLVPASMREVGLWPPVEEAPKVESAPETLESQTFPAMPAAEGEKVPSTDPGKAAEGETVTSAHSSKGAEAPAGAEAEIVTPAQSSEETDVPAASAESAAKSPTSTAVAAGVAPKAAIESDAVESLIRWYCREAGVRNLQKQIEKISRKLAMRVVEHREAKKEREEGDQAEGEVEGTPQPAVSAEPPKLVVTEDSLNDLVGKPPFTSDRLYEGALPAGTVTGLAWTAMGGSVLYMEATALPHHEGKKGGSPSLSVTGQLGSVMKESSQLALLIARRNLAECAPSDRKNFFQENELHLHCPEGAVPKDGPSAGITMVTALLSLGLDMPARADLAMTGEVSLNGKVLAIGGLKEKTIAARRAGCKALIFPQANRRDFDELPAYLKDGLEVHFATEYSDVFAVAFPDHIDNTTSSGSSGGVAN